MILNLTTEELSTRIKYDCRTIRERLKDSVLLEEGFAMGNIRARSDNGKWFFDFRFQGKRCREQTTLDNNTANTRKLKKILEQIEAEITLGSFEYAKYFPNSPMAAKFVSPARELPSTGDTPLFKDFAETWLAEMRIQWRDSHYNTMCHTFKKHLNPAFGDRAVSCITKVDILNFRSSLANVPYRNNGGLSATRINHILTPLRMLEAADRYDFITPYRRIKSLKIPKTDVQPFTLDEVKLILATVRSDFKD
ncbi:Phage integrase [hydrothermal vent metagenome]|uniref:Phage integrase n=1 Tax=hydrothermal vent metagenome TaxID=652676 RepID=A0A3B1B7H8_9ZZZZ